MEIAIENSQLGFAFLQEAERPVLAPVDDLRQFESEADAINYCIEHYAKRHGHALTQTTLATQLRMTKQVLSKLRQGDVSMPRNRTVLFGEVTKCWAYQQWLAFKSGLVLKTREQEKEQRDEIARLRSQLKEKSESLEAYKRAVGE